MSNQAYSVAEDLMVGAGTLYFHRSDDPNGFHHLGNVDEFNITNETEKIDKNSSMNKRRELMASVVTSIKPTASITMTEYNPYNMALGLYGKEGVMHQDAKSIVNEDYVVTSVPGIINLVDDKGNRYMDVKNVVVSMANTTPATIEATTGKGALTVSGSSGFIDTAGGIISVDLDDFSSTEDTNIYFAVATAPTATSGSLDGMVVKLQIGNLGATQVFTCPAGTGTTWLIGEEVDNLPKFTFTVVEAVIDDETGTVTTPGTTFTASASSTLITDGSILKYTAAPSDYKVGQDYTIDAQELRAGVIKIPENSKIQKGDTIKVSATIPERTFITISGGNAADISGELLFIGDPNVGGQYNIEAWKVKITPDGDFTGLIGTDFGTFTLNVDFLTDYDNHPDYPYYRATYIGKAGVSSADAGVYDPKY